MNISADALKLWLDAEYEEYLSFLKELVEINSFSLNSTGSNRVQDLLQRELKICGMHVERTALDSCGDYIFAKSCPDESGYLMLAGHVDTVHSEDSGFSSFRLDGERGYGPGCCDMKGGLVTIVWIIKALNHFGLLDKIPVAVSLNADEELGSCYSRELIEERCRSAKAALVFEWERENKTLISSRYGNAVYKVTVLGQSAHSANSPDTGRNAIVLMSRIISNLTEANTPGAIITPGIISGGSSVNTVPERAEVDFDIRALSEDDFKEIDKRFTEIVNRYSSGGYRVEVSCESKNPPFKKSDTSLELFKQLNRSASTAGSSFNLNTEALRGGSDANIISACGVPTLDGLGPYGEGAHTHEEFVFIPSIQEKVMSVSLFLANHLKL